MKLLKWSSMLLFFGLFLGLWGCTSCQKEQDKKYGSFAPSAKKSAKTEKKGEPQKKENKKSSFDYSHYADALKYVDATGMVNYGELKKNRENNLDLYVKALADLKVKTYESWSKKEQLAFWINAYNGLTLKVIIDHYPIESSLLKSISYPKNSIRQISGAWDKIKHNAMGKELVLDGIEHKILRKYFDEPRIHMALVCAAMGCPPLRNDPYTAEKVDKQLDDQTEKFLSHPKKFKIDKEGGTVYLSSIFNWFGKDFLKKYGTDKEFKNQDAVQRAVLNFISSYLGEDERKYLKEKEYSLSYFSYDWTLNEQN